MQMVWRDRAVPWRNACSLTIRKVFCFDAKFSSESVLLSVVLFELENVAFAYVMMNQLHIPKLLGVIWSSE